MKLRKLILHGFKSFADRTCFTFGDGITAIVGPNGCGKSNIVDACKWVLGEQSAKSLRGKEMLDVIFNGSTARKPAGMAEVTLVFENDRGLLGDQLAEVSITRRLYRSSESEYLINNQQVRLKDIKELFMDTGVGVGAYSLIEQGRVEVLLQSSPVERRAVFEEAAGISKYKARRKEASRKLERTQNNLDRLTDIIDEVEKRLRSVKNQAGRARNWQVCTQRLKELRVSYSLAEFDRYQKTEQTLTGALAEITATRDRLLGSQEELAAKHREAVALLEKVGEQLADAQSRRVQLEGRVSNARSRVAFQQRRRGELIEQLSRDREQIGTLSGRLQNLAGRIAEQRRESDQADDATARQSEMLDVCQDALSEHLAKVATARRRLEDAKSGVIDLMRRSSQLANNLAANHARHDSLTRQRSRLGERAEAVGGQISQLNEHRQVVKAQFVESQQIFDDASAQVASHRESATRLREQIAETSGELVELRERRSGLLSRQQILNDLENRQEGVGAGTRKLLAAVAENPAGHDSIQGLVADLLIADPHYAGLIEASLGGADEALVADDSNRLLAQIGERIEEIGQADLVCIDLLGPFSDGQDFSWHPQYVGRAIDYVSYPPEAGPVAWHLLGRTIITQQLDGALDLRRQSPPNYRFVTLDGHVVDQDGTLSLSRTKAPAGLLSRKSELGAIDGELAEINERIERIDRDLAVAAAENEQVEATVTQLRQSIDRARDTRTQADTQLAAVDRRLAELGEERPVLDSEMDQLAEEMAEAVAGQSSDQEQIQQLGRQRSEREQCILAVETELAELEQRREQLEGRATELKVALSATRERRTAAVAMLESLHRSRDEMNQSVARLRTELAAADERILEIELTELAASADIADACSEKDVCEDAVGQLAARRDELHAEDAACSSRLGEIAKEVHDLEQQIHANELRASENRLKTETLADRIRDDFGIEIAEMYAEYEGEENDWDAVEAEIKDLKARIDRLGNVNLDAIAELDELQVRFNFLDVQRTDLQDAMRQLEQLIARLNRESLTRFVETFNQVRENFQDLFRKLFGGGKADIILEDPDNPLDSGIEIMARPPGKENRSISLLSGGEKTMTCVALLLAVFKSKPSPYCLLDEVDAALDETNTERFGRVIGEFLTHSQFIIVTHSKRTMAIADVMYGVTMQNRGVSRKVSVKFEQGAALAPGEDTEGGQGSGVRGQESEGRDEKSLAQPPALCPLTPDS